MTTKRTLRELAIEKGGQSDPRSNIDVLLSTVRPAQRDEILDLLNGHPRIAHVVVADVLNEAFGDQMSKPVNAQQVSGWRSKSNHLKAAA